MPPPMKRAKQAKQQCSSGSKNFDHGLIDDLLQLSTDPNFIPDISDSDLDPENLNEGHAWSFSLLDESNIQVGDEPGQSDSDEVVEVHCGKRKERDEGEKFDYVDTCAAQAAQKAHNFWAGIFNSVMSSYLLDI